jgi:hypothetical protein
MRYITSAILLALMLSPVVLFLGSAALAIFADTLVWRIVGWVGIIAALGAGAWLLYDFAFGMGR